MDPKEIETALPLSSQINNSFLGNVIEICIVTHDHRRAMAGLSKLGIGPWRVYTFTPENTARQTYKGEPSPFTLQVCFAPLGSLTCEIIQPVSGRNIFSDFLDEHGEGVHHVAYDCNEIPFAERLAGFAARGFGAPVQSGCWMGGNEFAFFATESETTTCFETLSFPSTWEFPEPDLWFPAAPTPSPPTPPPLSNPQSIPAGRASLTLLPRTRTLRLTNPTGTQPISLWALHASRPGAEHLSMSHTRSSVRRLSPAVGDVLVSNLRKPMLTFARDTSAGFHDTLIAACDPARYRQLGAQKGHPSCCANFQACLAAALGPGGDNRDGERDPTSSTNPLIPTPDPWNLFLHVSHSSTTGSLSLEPPGQRDPAQQGSAQQGSAAVELRAEMDLWVVLSPCPMDLVDGFGPPGAGEEVAFEIF